MNANFLFKGKYINVGKGSELKIELAYENYEDLNNGVCLSVREEGKLIVNASIPKDDFEGIINKVIYKPGVEPKDITFNNEKFKDEEVKKLIEQLAERDRIIENMKADFEKNIKYKQREVDEAYNLCKKKNEESKQIEKDTNAAVSRLTKERDFLMGLCLDYEKALGGK